MEAGCSSISNPGTYVERAKCGQGSPQKLLGQPPSTCTVPGRRKKSCLTNEVGDEGYRLRLSSDLHICTIARSRSLSFFSLSPSLLLPPPFSPSCLPSVLVRRACLHAVWFGGSLLDVDASPLVCAQEESSVHRGSSSVPLHWCVLTRRALCTVGPDLALFSASSCAVLCCASVVFILGKSNLSNFFFTWLLDFES